MGGVVGAGFAVHAPGPVDDSIPTGQALAGPPPGGH